MEPHGNRLGLIAIILGAVALVVALSARDRTPSMPMHRSREVPAIQTPPAHQAPSPPHAPRFERDDWQDKQPFAGGERWNNSERFTERRHGPFFGLFWFFGGLLRLLIALLLIVLGLRLLRRSGWGGPGSHRRGSGHSGEPRDPPPGTPMGPPFQA